MNYEAASAGGSFVLRTPDGKIWHSITKHYPGGSEHDQSTHGNWANGGGGGGGGGGNGAGKRGKRSKLYDVGITEVDGEFEVHWSEDMPSTYEGREVNRRVSGALPQRFETREAAEREVAALTTRGGGGKGGNGASTSTSTSTSPRGKTWTKAQRRPLYEVADEIASDWGHKVNYAAKPYLDAMRSLDGVRDNYGYDSGESIVAYFLSNARSWTGETAKRVKAELKAAIKR